MARRPKETIDEHGQVRDRRDEWRTGNALYEEPVFVWPPRPKELLKWLFGWPGYLWPWNAVYVGICAVAYFWLTPPLETMATLQIDWIALIFARNVALLLLVAGGLHLWLWRWKKQGRKYKYNGRWQDQQDSTFLFGNQVWDNMFWSIVSGCTIWTAYEAGLWWAYANDWLPYSDNWLLFIAWMLFMPVWRLFHFYWVHRLIHWEPLYKACHYIHHKNVNIGPWSGMSMHPLEHIFYFSCMLIHVIVPSHPFIMLFNGLHTGLTPAQGHSGFDEIVWGDKHAWENEQIMHYMHHRYHTVNYGESIFPLDRWFGTFHNGTAEADAEFRKAKQRRQEQPKKMFHPI